MTSEYGKLIIQNAVSEAFTNYLFSPRFANVAAEAENLGDGDCTCDQRSWYGEGHDSACPVTIFGDADAIVIADFADYLKEQTGRQ